MPDAKMTRQLKLYYYLIHSEYHGPEDLMTLFDYPNVRMMQRDMKDLRDSGLIADIRLDRKEKNYIVSDEYGEICTNTGKRRLEHLVRLQRLGIIITEFEPTNEYKLLQYEDDIAGYKDDMEIYKDDPEGYIEQWGDKPVKPEPMNFFDVKKAYCQLFPDSSERTKQRDFQELREAGYFIEYRRDLKAYVITDEMMLEEY